MGKDANTKTLIVALEPLHSNAKSFYGKAHQLKRVVNGEHIHELYSYDEFVAKWQLDDDGNDIVQLLPGWDYSATTLRHVKEFILQNCDGWIIPKDISDTKLTLAALRNGVYLEHVDSNYQQTYTIDIKAV